MKIELNHPVTFWIAGIISLALILCGVAFQSSCTSTKESVLDTDTYKKVIYNKMPKNIVKLTVKDMKCNDTCWLHDIKIDDSYDVWLDPSTAVNSEFQPYFPIKVIKMLDSSFTVDLLKCEDDFIWIKCNDCDYKISEYHHVNQIVYKERLKNDTKKK